MPFLAIDKAVLINGLTHIADSLQTQAKGREQAKDVSLIYEAIEAVEQDDRPKSIEMLTNVGKWVGGFAAATGSSVLANNADKVWEAIKPILGL